MNKKLRRWWVVPNCLVVLTLCWGFSTALAQPQAAGKGRILLVGPGQELSLPSEAAAIARNGDKIKIDGTGLYGGDVARWSASNIHILGYNGRPHLQAAGNSFAGKALWVINGDNVIVENVEISGVTVPDKNGAAVRHQGRNLTLRRVYFHHNEAGLLTSNDRHNRVLVEYSELAYNGFGDGYSHNIYVGTIAELVVRFSYIHHAIIGHNIKSRARNTEILYNRIMDEYEGQSSYLIDIPYGGHSLIMGNSIQQGRATENPRMIAFGAENLLPNRASSLYVVNNTLVNESRLPANFIWAKGSGYPVIVANNLFYGRGKLYKGPGKAGENAKPGPVDMPRRRDFNYALGPAAAGVDKAVPVQTGAGEPLLPDWEYRHRAAAARRPSDGHLDMGAHEYQPLVIYGSRSSWFAEQAGETNGEAEQSQPFSGSLPNPLAEPFNNSGSGTAP